MLSNWNDIYDRLNNPASSPHNIQMFGAVRQMREEASDYHGDNSELRYQPVSAVIGPPAPLPYPLISGGLQFVRDGDNYFGLVSIIMNKGVRIKGFSGVLGGSLSDRFKWINTDNDGVGYVYDGEGNGPTVSISGVSGCKVPIRNIWVGAAGAIPRLRDKDHPEWEEEFKKAIVNLGEITNVYVNSLLKFLAGRRRFVDKIRGKRYENPDDLVVHLSCF